MKKITFVTGNKNKVKEAESILGFSLNVEDIDLEEIQDLDTKKITLHKLSEAYAKVKRPVIVDDAGFYIDAWNGFPGPFIKWLLKSGESDLLLKMMKGEKNRKAHVKLAIGFHDGKKQHIFTGEVKGEIASEKRGEEKKGWWDQVFIPGGYTKTFAEMTTEQKNKISHRRKGLEKFKEYLKKEKFIPEGV